jgi:hypothetical protein
MRLHNLLSLPHLLKRDTKGKKSLIDYSQSHFVISFEYLNILRRKKMEKVLAEEIRTCKRKEKEDKQTTKMGSTIK